MLKELNLSLITPEMIILIMANVILLADVFFNKKIPQISYYLSQASILAALYATYSLTGMEAAFAVNAMVKIDPLGTFYKQIILIISFFVFIYARKYLKGSKLPFGEFYILAMCGILGMMVLVSSANLIPLYLGLELISLPIYTLVAINRDSKLSSEAAMKYFVMGALATGMMLYGMSILFGLSGTLDIANISAHIAALPLDKTVLAAFAFIFVLVGVAFKFGAAPFHMWVPDVYQGAPLASTLFISTAPKVAALGMALRLFNEAFEPIISDYQTIFIILAVLSLAIGNVIAIAQTNLRRMLAFSTIAHIGFVFLGLLVAPDVGFAAVSFYIVIYALMVLGVFGLITVLSSNEKEIHEISDLKGLNEKRPFMALLMLMLMFSLAGVPPMAGFYAKFLIINGLIDAGFVALAVVAVVFSIIGAFYYLRVVKTMYFDKASGEFNKLVPVDANIAITINGLSALVLGIVPGPIISLLAQIS